jgi:hypothetical protein
MDDESCHAIQISNFEADVLMQSDEVEQGTPILPNSLINLAILPNNDAVHLNVRKQSSSGFKVIAPTAKVAMASKENGVFGATSGSEIFKCFNGLAPEALGARQTGLE